MRLPSVCALCSHYHKNSLILCPFCIKLLVKIKHGCLICRKPLLDVHESVCIDCLKMKPLFDDVICDYVFAEPLRTLIHQFKYEGAFYLSALFTQLMIHSLNKNKEQLGCLVPVPLHATRLKERGFNQAAVLTKQLAQSLNIPYDLNLCKKIMRTPEQASLTKRQRQGNLKNAFIVKKNNYSIITVVDDLLTTGETANELARIIKINTQCHVNIWCIARTFKL